MIICEFAVHGRLLRIMMASIFYHSLARMSEFEHHNTCINVVDVIISNEGAKERDAPDRTSTDNVALVTVPTAFLPQGKKAPDDNVDLPPPTPAEVAQAAERKKQAGNIRDHSVTAVTHPKHLTFVPVVLDSIDHLAECYR
ncbi:hypothetical protein HDU86_001072 [Geranomyces michiganensis]|nr:hypothetical protein HDU86_001072 [Geranomyces michiganensis]